MALSKNQPKRGHLRGVSKNKTAKTGRTAPEKTQKTIGTTRAKAAAPANGVRDGGLVDNRSTSYPTSETIKRADDGVGNA